MEEKIKVLSIAFNNLEIGGIQRIIMTTAQTLNNYADFDVVVFTEKPAYFDEEFRKYGKIFRCPHYEGSNILKRKVDYYVRYFRIKRNIYRILKENGPYNVVHSHNFFEAAPCVAAAKKAGVPIRIVHSHNTGVRNKRRSFSTVIQAIYREIYRGIIKKNATHLIGCSQAAADYLFGKGAGVPIYNCVDCKRFQLSLYNCKPHTDLRLIHVGNFTQQKNQLFLLDVLKLAVEKRKDIHLTLIGRRDNYYYKVLEKIRVLELCDYITILPSDADVPKAMAEADLFIFPSLYEGFPLVVLEAQAMGLKCITSAEVTHEVDCGLVDFIPLDAGAEYWANSILEEAALSIEKHPADMSNFSEEHFSEQILKIYKGEA